MSKYKGPNRIISTERLVELIAAENTLMALEDGGVSEWNGFLPSLLLYHLQEGCSEGIWSLFPEEILEDIGDYTLSFPIVEEGI